MINFIKNWWNAPSPRSNKLPDFEHIPPTPVKDFEFDELKKIVDGRQYEIYKSGRVILLIINEEV